MMFWLEEMRMINTMHKLILAHKTGTPDEFASRMCMSRRNLYRTLSCLKDLGAEISYSKTLQSFYYKRRFTIKTFVEINGEEYLTINGGASQNDKAISDYRAIFWHRSKKVYTRCISCYNNWVSLFCLKE